MTILLYLCTFMPAEQEQFRNNEKWKIAQGCGLDKLMTILIAIRNKNGDTEYIEDEKFKNAIDLSKSLLTGNLTFLNSINLLEKKDGKTKLTKIGSEFTEAWVRDDDNISKLIEQIIKESPLVDLYDYIQTNKGIKIAKIFTFIKAQAKISDASDGRPFADIPFQGVKTVIRLFEKANLLSSEQIKEFKDYRNSNPNSPTTKKQKTKSGKKTTDVKKSVVAPDSRGNLSLTSGIEIQLNSSKNVEFAIMQLNDLLDELKGETVEDESIEMNDENIDDTSDSTTPSSNI